MADFCGPAGQWISRTRVRMMGWPRDTVDFPEPTPWNGDDDDFAVPDEADGFHCPCCGEPHDHYADGVCKQCWIEMQYHGDCDGDGHL